MVEAHAESDAGTTGGFESISPPHSEFRQRARDLHKTLTKPFGSLGRVETIGEWMSACQGQCPPHRIERPRVIVFAGDHGIAHAGVSAYPAEVTQQMMANIAAGGAAVNVLAAQHDVGVRVIDMSVDCAVTDPEVGKYKVRRASADFRFSDAMTPRETRQALQAGRDIADNEIDSGADLLMIGDLGIGNTTPASVLVGVYTGIEPVKVVGRGTGIDDNLWMSKTAAIRDGMRRGRRVARDPLGVLAAVTGPDFAAMAGFLAQSALRRTPVILDGVVVTSAALVANDIAMGARQWWIAGHQSTEPAHQLALRHLGLEPILDFGMRLGEGSGALMAYPIVVSAVETMRGMATFSSAGVSEKTT